MSTLKKALLVAVSVVAFGATARAQTSLYGTGLRLIPRTTAPVSFGLGRVGLWSPSGIGAMQNHPLWRNADGSDTDMLGLTLQSAYTAGGGTIALTTPGGGILIKDNVVPIGGNLLSVTNSTGSQTYFAVTAGAGGTTSINLNDGSSSPLSGVNTGTIIYNNTLHLFQQSINGGAYTAFGGSTGNWTFSADTASDTATSMTISPNGGNFVLTTGAAPGTANTMVAWGLGTTFGGIDFGGTGVQFFPGAGILRLHVAGADAWDFSTTSMVPDIVALTIGTSGTLVKGTFVKFPGGVTGAALASAPTITPTQNLHHVTGTAQIGTISTANLPSGWNGHLTLIFDGVAPLITGGNIETALTPTVNKAYDFVWDGTFWYVQAGG